MHDCLHAGFLICGNRSVMHITQTVETDVPKDAIYVMFAGAILLSIGISLYCACSSPLSVAYFVASTLTHTGGKACRPPVSVGLQGLLMSCPYSLLGENRLLRGAIQSVTLIK